MDILPQLLVNALISGSLYALATSGLALTFGLLRILNFAHGHILMLGAYLYYYGVAEQGLGIFSAALLAAGVLMLVAAASLQIFVLPFLRLNELLPFVTTLALSIILESTVSMIWGVNVKSISVGVSNSSYEIAGIYITPIQIIIILSAVVLLSILAFGVHATSFGRKIRALSEFPPAAQSLGVNCTRIYFLIFIVGALLAGYAGVLAGYETNLQPTMGSIFTIKAFAAMILGGLGSIWGAVLASYILGLVENLSIGLDFWGYSLPAGYKDAFAFVIILLVLLFRPRGIFNVGMRRA